MNLHPAVIVSSVKELAALVSTFSSGRSVHLLTDINVSEFWLAEILAELNEFTEVDVIETDAGESIKNLDTCSQIWSHLLEARADRHSLLINLGGGVITDLGGFIASTYKRGIHFINVPTTLMGMVDASIGGKTGIDHDHIKNAIGIISPSVSTIVYPGFLTTLPEKEMLSGFAEMLKHTLISDVLKWNSLIDIGYKNLNALTEHINDSIRIKEEIVQRDPNEFGERKLLNLGHSIGHALESWMLSHDQPITHGEAIAFGIMCETIISAELNMIEVQASKNIFDGLRKYFSFQHLTFPVSQELLPFLYNDKKNQNGKLFMTLPVSIGQAHIHIEVHEQIIVQALSKMSNLLR